MQYVVHVDVAGSQTTLHASVSLSSPLAYAQLVLALAEQQQQVAKALPISPIPQYSH
jgi:hypothetical protein